MTIPGAIIIPALTFRTPDGALDEATTTRYAEAAAATWLDYFIVSGTTTEGNTFTVDERARVLDIWLSTTDPARLVACCWERADIDTALERGIRPMAVMRRLDNDHEALAFLRALPESAFAYSHPAHTPTVLDNRLVSQLHNEVKLPLGAKISKLPDGELDRIRKAAGHSFLIWDGSSRQIASSFRDGANGVVVTPLAFLPPALGPQAPRLDMKGLQDLADRIQHDLDLIQGSHDRAEWLRNCSREAPRRGQIGVQE